MSSFLNALNQALADQARPVSRRLQELFPDIEAAMAKGFSRAQIVEALKAEGIEISVAMLSTYLQRLRQRRSQLPARASASFSPPSSPPSSSAQAPGVAPTTSSPPDTSFRYGQHDPRRLDEVLSTPPDMNAYAKKAKRGTKR